MGAWGYTQYNNINKAQNAHRISGPKVETTHTVASSVVANPMRKRFWLVARTFFVFVFGSWGWVLGG